MDTDSRISPSLHPAVLAKVDGYGADTAEALTPAAEALRTIYSGLGAIHDARESAKRNPTWNEAAQILETDKFADRHLKVMTGAVDKAVGGLRAGIAELERELTSPLTSKAGDPIATEIRAYARSLDDDKRRAFIAQAMQDGDSTTLTAVLGTVPYLSGIDAKMQEVYVRLYHEAREPAKARRLRAMQGAHALLSERFRLILSETTKAIGAKPEKLRALRAAKTAAEQAFIVRDAA